LKQLVFGAFYFISGFIVGMQSEGLRRKDMEKEKLDKLLTVFEEIGYRLIEIRGKDYTAPLFTGALYFTILPTPSLLAAINKS
jgi:hypothetical protein